MKKSNVIEYIEALDRGIQNALDQLEKAPANATLAVDNVISMLSLFKNQTTEAQLKLLRGEIK